MSQLQTETAIYYGCNNGCSCTSLCPLHHISYITITITIILRYKNTMYRTPSWLVQYLPSSLLITAH